MVSENNRACNWLCDALQCLVMCQHSADSNTVTDHDSQGRQADKHRKEVGTRQAVREAKTTRGSSLIKREQTLLINREQGCSRAIPSLSQEARWTSYAAATPQVAFSARSTVPRGCCAVPCCRRRRLAFLRLLPGGLAHPAT